MSKILILIIALFISFSVNAGMLVIGNKDFIGELSRDEIKNLFMGKRVNISKGQKVIIVELAEGFGGRREFHDISTGRSDSQLQSAWSILIFTGKSEKPIEVGSYEEVIKVVKKYKNAIGYIHDSALTNEVNVLFKY